MKVNLEKIILQPIGTVHSSRKVVEDDNWDQEQAFVELDFSIFTPDALAGLTDFSHVEILFFMNQVDPAKVEKTARHPRNNTAWPKVGIFAQRGKNRPNQIGSTICRIENVDGLKLYLEGLDAVDGTPVIDIKPWVEEFGPRGEVNQPQWISELMREYWSEAKVSTTGLPTSSLVVRMAKSEDIPMLCRLFREGAEYHIRNAPHWFQLPSESWIQNFVSGFLQNPKVIVMVAQDGPEIAGSIRAEQRQSPSAELFKPLDFLHIDEVIVGEKFRHRGVAKTLITEIENIARVRSIHEVTLNVWNFNDPAKSLYSGLDYEQERIVMKKDIR